MQVDRNDHWSHCAIHAHCLTYCLYEVGIQSMLRQDVHVGTMYRLWRGRSLCVRIEIFEILGNAKQNSLDLIHFETQRDMGVDL
jgi:hypothetical protein